MKYIVPEKHPDECRVKITDRKKLVEKNIDVKKLAMDLDTAFIRMLLRDDIFHADPHPGNISVLDDGKMLLYDFGMTGDLNDKTIYYLLSLYDAMTRGDVDQMTDALIGVKALSPQYSSLSCLHCSSLSDNPAPRRLLH